MHRRQRQKQGFTTISLAGYTHSGKSTLFNLLAQESVPTDKGAFTTLSTTTRSMSLNGKQVLITDTVGFIDELPVTLIEAFHSTLEETILADLILLVVDVSEPVQDIKRKMSVSLETIRRIGVQGIPVVTAFNKMDLLSDDELKQRMLELSPSTSNCVSVSAKHETNVNLLKQELAKFIMNYLEATFRVPLSANAISFLSWVFRYADVKDVKYEGGYVEVSFEAVPSIAHKVLNRISRLGGVVKELA